jgi:hypothetical protein
MIIKKKPGYKRLLRKALCAKETCAPLYRYSPWCEAGKVITQSFWFSGGWMSRPSLGISLLFDME